MNSEPTGKIRRFLFDPPLLVEIVVWVMLVVAIAGIRIYIAHLVPTILWSRDAGSYTNSAFHWLHTGDWITDPRRGPIYSLFIAGCLKLWGSFDALMVAQHLLGGAAVLAGIVVLRLMHGRAVIIPVGLCGYAYAVYGLPIHMEHLVRNETLLFFFATLILSSWFIAIDRNQPHWLWIAGIAAGLMQLTKPVFAPFPLVLIALYLWFFRRQLRRAILPIGVFLTAFLLPLIAVKVQATLSKHRRPPEPQSGILFFGRTAQFTVLDGGIDPEAKQVIRQDILDYVEHVRTQGLNNNIILKETAVPHLQKYYHDIGKTPAELNKLCRRLAVEAIMAHKAQYARQVLRDLALLHRKSCSFVQNPTASDLDSSRRTLETTNPDPSMHVDQAKAILDARLEGDPRTQKSYFSTYRHRVDESWLFLLAPVLITTLLLPFFIFFSNEGRRIWWLGCAAMWYFTLILLSTVGRPLDRYMLPVVPIIFWAQGSAVISGVCWLLSRFTGRTAKNPVLCAQSV